MFLVLCFPDGCLLLQLLESPYATSLPDTTAIIERLVRLTAEQAGSDDMVRF